MKQKSQQLCHDKAPSWTHACDIADSKGTILCKPPASRQVQSKAEHSEWRRNSQIESTKILQLVRLDV